MASINGTRGRSKKNVRLTVDTIFQTVAFNVWEEGKISHSFYADKEFCEAMVKHASNRLEQIREEESRRK